MSRRAVFVAAALGAALATTAACTSTTPSSAGPKTSVPVEDPPSSSSPVHRHVGKPRMDRQHWRQVRIWNRREKESFGVFDERFTLLYPGATERRFASVQRAPGSLVLKHAIGGSGWQSQDGWLTKRAAVYLDINLDQRIARLTVYSLPSGQRAPWSGDGSLSGISPEADVGGDWLAYFTGEPKTRMCLRTLNLQTMRPGMHECGAKGEILGEPAINDGTLVFARLTHHESKTKRCKALNVVDLDTGQHQSKTERAIRRHAGCSAWDGVAYAGGVAWDEMDPSGSVLDTSPGFYLRPDGTIVDLGNIGTDSMEPCGDTLVWMVIPHMGQVLAWRPGHRPRVILDPRRAASPSLIQCTEDRWLTTNVDDITGHNEKLRFLALDVSKL